MGLSVFIPCQQLFVDLQPQKHTLSLILDRQNSEHFHSISWPLSWNLLHISQLKIDFLFYFVLQPILGVFTLNHLFVDLMLLYSYKHVKLVAYLGLGGKAVQCICSWQLHVTTSKKLGTLDSSKLSHRAAVDYILNIPQSLMCWRIDPQPMKDASEGSWKPLRGGT